jgi:hypothetical protein
VKSLLHGGQQHRLCMTLYIPRVCFQCIGDLWSWGAFEDVERGGGQLDTVWQQSGRPLHVCSVKCGRSFCALQAAIRCILASAPGCCSHSCVILTPTVSCVVVMPGWRLRVLVCSVCAWPQVVAHMSSWLLPTVKILAVGAAQRPCLFAKQQSCGRL